MESFRAPCKKNQYLIAIFYSFAPALGIIVRTPEFMKYYFARHPIHESTKAMKKLSEWNSPSIRYLFCDIDDTITTDGQIHAEAYSALWELHKAGIEVIPVTGRPAGWCEMIARVWPVKAIIGENGAFYFSYNQNTKKMERFFFQEEAEMQSNLQKITALGDEALRKFPGTALASDQFCRMLDVAIDFCEDVEDLGRETAEKIKEFFVENNAVAKVSSIHVNAWFGDHNKLSMCKVYCKKEIGSDFENLQPEICFVGDSPNDEPMFAAFQNSVGVANVLDFKESFEHLPTYICKKKSGQGFIELSKLLCL